MNDPYQALSLSAINTCYYKKLVVRVRVRDRDC